MTLAQEAAKLVESLPPDKAEAALDYLRYLTERTEPMSAGDLAWEERLATAHTLPKFRAFVAEVEREIAEGKATPLNPEDL